MELHVLADKVTDAKLLATHIRAAMAGVAVESRLIRRTYMQAYAWHTCTYEQVYLYIYQYNILIGSLYITHTIFVV